jgi:polyisoprenoid-binding protein YceI
MRKIFSIAVLAAAVTAQAGAQETTKLQLEPGTELSISGTSTVHAFTCKTNRIDATLIVDRGYTKDLTKIARPIVSVRVEIPAKSLDCGNGKMNDNMYGTLKAKDNPTITYVMSGYDLENTTATGFAAKTQGTLTIAGKEKVISMTVKADRVEDTKATAKGEQSILLTDFGIKPPSFMLGALKVGNEIKIKFNLKAGPATMAQIAAAMTGVETQ